MDQSKLNIIYHIPWSILQGKKSSTSIRPIEMMRALQQLADVNIVMGTGVERAGQIQDLKKRIKAGESFDFVYSESSTAPTLIASGWKDSLRYGNQDLKFLKFCKKNQIPIGLFYRDIYWKFQRYMAHYSFFKRTILTFLYPRDLKKYSSILDIMYLPHKEMNRYVKFPNVKELPPGFQKSLASKERGDVGSINCFYVGGLDENYEMGEMFNAIPALEGINFNVCTREEDWIRFKKMTTRSPSPNLRIMHLSGEPMLQELQNSDIAMLFVEPLEYWTFVMPVKLFDYISAGKPIIASEGTAAAQWIKDNELGWVIPYSSEALKDLLKHLKDNPEEIEQKTVNIAAIAPKHSWKARAEQVVRELTSL